MLVPALFSAASSSSAVGAVAVGSGQANLPISLFIHSKTIGFSLVLSPLFIYMSFVIKWLAWPDPHSPDHSYMQSSHRNLIAGKTRLKNRERKAIQFAFYGTNLLLSHQFFPLIRHKSFYDGIFKKDQKIFAVSYYM